MNSTMNRSIHVAILTFTAFCGQASAHEVQVRHQDAANHCDRLLMPFNLDELGSPSVPFPEDELIDHETIGETTIPVCPLFDDTSLTDAIVSITNLTDRTFSDLWYIASPKTSISNYDGFAEDVLAGIPPRYFTFKLDHAETDPNGVHHPVLSESIAMDGLFTPGESWDFVLQDYRNAFGIPPDDFTSLQVGSASMVNAAGMMSSGSIVALPVPEPATFAGSLCLMLACLGSRLRRQPL